MQNTDLALEKLQVERFEAAMVDDRAPEVAVKVLDAAKALPPSQPCLGVVLAEPQMSCKLVFATLRRRLSLHLLRQRPENRVN